MKPYFPQNRLREVVIPHNVVVTLKPKEIMRLYAQLGVIIHTEYMATNYAMLVFAGHPDFEPLKSGETIPKYCVEV